MINCWLNAKFHPEMKMCDYCSLQREKKEHVKKQNNHADHVYMCMVRVRESVCARRTKNKEKSQFQRYLIIYQSLNNVCMSHQSLSSIILVKSLNHTHNSSSFSLVVSSFFSAIFFPLFRFIYSFISLSLSNTVCESHCYGFDCAHNSS